MKVFVLYFLVALLLPNFSISLPVGDSTTDSLVLIKDETTPITEEKKEEPRPPTLKSMLVTSDIRNRYGTTVVSSKYANPDSRSQEATFSINLPDTAFISRFVMEIEGKQYEAYVREKEQAKKEYQQAVSQGLGAAHVAVNARDSNKFTVSVNVEPQSKVVFNLTYEELLVRKHDKYEMVVNLNPGQLVKDLKVHVHINETRKITNVLTPAIRSGNEILDPSKIETNKYAVTKIEDDNNVFISFEPNIEQQREMMKLLKPKDKKNDAETDNGISGQFVIEYDVERDPQGGEVLVNDGYFVHFFAPTELKPIPKHVVFVLDCSGSMFGRKIEQLREAMKIILGELNSNDYFNIVKFHSTVQVLDLNKNNTWTEIEIAQESELPQGFAATPENIKNAQDVVEEMQDEGLTNIIDALTVGLRITSKGLPAQQDNKHKPQPIIVFLTDGQANVGESRPKEMIEHIEKRNSVDNKAAIFTLSFGNDANKEFLKELALKNSGFLRTIYEAADASLQLQDFYKQISSPLLTNVQFNYSENKVQQLTQHKFDILFKGSELVVAGKLVNSDNENDLAVEAFTIDGSRSFIPHIIPIFPRPPLPERKQEVGSLERLWAYLTIKQLLDKKYISNDDSEKKSNETDAHEKEALKLALKYSFVTPLTSLVVVKPNKTESIPEEDTSVLFGESAALPLYFSAPSGAAAFSNRVSSVQYAFPAMAAGFPGPPAPPPQYFSTTIRHKPLSLATTEIASTTTINNSFTIDELPWLAPLISDAGELTINNQKYLIGNNQTSVEVKKCQVTSLNLSGSCTLLTQCPTVYSKLNSFETYEQYFCSLESDKYAGVCCPESKED